MRVNAGAKNKNDHCVLTQVGIKTITEHNNKLTIDCFCVYMCFYTE